MNQIFAQVSYAVIPPVILCEFYKPIQETVDSKPHIRSREPHARVIEAVVPAVGYASFI